MDDFPDERPPVPELRLLSSPDWKDYELLDSGNGLKLERYGRYTLVRPEPQATWQPAIGSKQWQAAHAVFQPAQEESGGQWQFNKPVEPGWVMSYKGLKFRLQTTAGRHLGVFPEQAAQWDWIEETVRLASRPVQVLNLFGYTGLATLAAARAGAKVTHVDASKKSIAWGRENQALSDLSELPVRWILDDALKFTLREARRGVKYDGLILDPPKFGRGPKGEVWEFFRLLPELLKACRLVLSEQPLFVCLTAYAIRLSALSLYYSLEEMTAGLGGQTTAGELVLVERSARRMISMAIYARWSNSE
jgi:23S rRNA (cytosine1962-C5)-methyltransferase